jgi:hypothetical protein
MLDIQIFRRRHSSGHLVAGVLLGLGLTLTLTQCRLAPDTVTGATLQQATSLSHRNSCNRKCGDAAKAAQRDEERRHRAAQRACHSDKQCRKAEEALHKSNEKAIDQARHDCKKGCYNEGGGHGGGDHD